MIYLVLADPTEARTRKTVKMNKIVRKIVPVAGLMFYYVRYLKPSMVSAAQSLNGRSLLLHLFARSTILVPMVVATGFLLFHDRLNTEHAAEMFDSDVQATFSNEDEENNVNGTDVVYYVNDQYWANDDGPALRESIETAVRDFQEAHGPWTFE